MVYTPDGQRFRSTVELAEQTEREKLRAEAAEAENDRLRALLAIDPRSGIDKA